jgi:hypothetical protein
MTSWLASLHDDSQKCLDSRCKNPKMGGLYASKADGT